MPFLHPSLNPYFFLNNFVNNPFNVHLYPCNPSLHQNKNPQRINYCSQSAYDNSKCYLLNSKNHLITSVFDMSEITRFHNNCYNFRACSKTPCFLSGVFDIKPVYLVIYIVFENYGFASSFAALSFF